MPDPCIVCVAITGSVTQKSHNPAVPISVDEQVESVHAAFETGAAIAHCHVRNADGSPSSDPEKFGLLLEGLRKHCAGMIVQFSTGGRSGTGKERGGMLALGADMASLAVGSNNFPTRVYENPPELIDFLAAEMARNDVKPEIEAFDLSHIFQTVEMVRDGRLAPNVHIQFVMGIKNAMPADREVFEFYVATVNRVLPEASWCGAGIGRHQLAINKWSLELGGHTRTGLEDNVRLNKSTLAPSNAALVQQVVDLCTQYERPVATWQQARTMLGLEIK